MSQKHVLVEYLSNINSVIKQPLQLTQRIKFTCFDVSNTYIVFGATSGGLYVFNRYPQGFIKLIPSKYGSVVKLCISPNQKTIALASSKGLIIVVQNCFTETNVQYQVFCEHENNVVTVIKWHLDEIFCGDNKGTVSVITLPSLLTKAIFQAPSASLMQLDSSIVQIESYSKFLLISTYTRTYICNTEKEQYRQIGKKLRDGRFGACFFANNVDSEISSAHASTSRGLFKKMKTDEQLIAHINDNVKIFCARPGARMWEAKLNASVTRTHQFKNFLKQKPANIIQLDNNVDSHLIINNLPDSDHRPSEMFNFSTINMLGSTFIISFSSDGFYIFDPQTVSLICWCNYFNGIKDAKIVKNIIYIWKSNFEVHVIGFYALEKVILKTLFAKQYYICAELCVNYMKDLLELVETSRKIHLVSILKEKLNDVAGNQLVTTLIPLFKAIQEFSDKKCFTQKLTTGIVVVNNPHAIKNIDFSESEPRVEKDYVPETFQTLKEIGANVTDKLTEGTRNFKEKLQVLEITVKHLTLNNVVDSTKDNDSHIIEDQEYEQENNIVESRDAHTELNNAEQLVELDNNLKLFLQQYQSSKINSKLEIPKFNELLASNSLDTVLKLFLNFMQHMLDKNTDEMSIKMWCYQYYLKHLSKIDFQEEIKRLEVEEQPMCFLLEAFCYLNLAPECSCACLFPLPSAKNRVAIYYDVGCAILKNVQCRKHDLFKKIHTEVPFMWKFIIGKLKNQDDINALLPLLIQFGEKDLIMAFLNKFKYDTWDDATKLLIKLKRNECLNCDNKFENSCDVMNWTEFGSLMMHSIGGPSTIHLLTRYANFIPSTELDADFYQSCIFATATDNFVGGFRKEAINFTKVIHSDEQTALQFDDLMATFLQKNYMKKPMKSTKNGFVSVEKNDLKCSFCDLPLEIPLLKGDVKLNCNHLYHAICFKYNKNICEICNK